MFTDIYFTNLTPVSYGDTRLAFFQKNVAGNIPCGTVFRVIEKCPSGWSHHVRIPWDLNFRMVKLSGNTTQPYPIKTCYHPEKTKFLLWKDGTVAVNQHYGNGKQIIDFEQIKGRPFSGVQFYRGKLLIAELYFKDKYLSFEIDTQITVIENNTKNETETIAIEDISPTVLDFDFTGIKAIHLSVNKKISNKLIIDDTERW